MSQNLLKAEVSQKCCSFYIQDDGKLQTREGEILPNFSLETISTWGIQSQITLLCYQKHL